MNVRSVTVLAAIALLAIAAWPFAFTPRAQAQRPYVAPVLPDYAWRDAGIRFYEQRSRSNPHDQVIAKLLAAQYMQRYRETQDTGDILRAIGNARRALVLQPQNNAAALEILGSAYTAMHQFKMARDYESRARRDKPWDGNAPAQIASLDMELGDYARADADLTAASRTKVTPTLLSVRARYLEVTGHLAQARALLREAMQQTDAIADNPAQSRAWYHFRAGELAFAAGQVDEAKQDERDALAAFPNFETAYRALARFCRATKDWNCALDAATKGAQVLPEPEILGYEADAQRALGDARAAARTQALILAVEQIGNAYHLSDRLLAVYYADHRLRGADALRIAQREVRVRGKEIYAQDTLAWAAAMAGRWNIADAASRSAVRYDTEDARLQYHRAVIALHFNRHGEARSRLEKALQLNSQFDAVFADDARRRLQQLQ